MDEILVVAPGAAMRRAISSGLQEEGRTVALLDDPCSVGSAIARGNGGPRVLVWDPGYEDQTEQVTDALMAHPELRVVYLTRNPWDLSDQDRVRCLLRPIVPEALGVATLRQMVSEALLL
jgi:hypothetical protein